MRYRALHLFRILTHSPKALTRLPPSLLHVLLGSWNANRIL